MKHRSRLRLWSSILAVVLSGLILCEIPHAQESTSTPQGPPAELLPTAQNQSDPKSQDEATEEEKLPTLSNMAIPDAITLLKKPPVDWIVLKTDEVIVVEPLEPRPGALEKQINDQLEAMRKPLPPQKNAMELEQARRRELGTLKITLADPEEIQPEYRIDVKLIREILYHEDLLLRRVDELLKSGHTEIAYELLSEIAEIAPGWRGTEERQIELLRTEARLALKAGNHLRARIRLLRLFELNAANRDDAAELFKLTRLEVEAALTAGQSRLAWETLQSLPLAIRQRPEWESLSKLLSAGSEPMDTISADSIKWEAWQRLLALRSAAPDLPLVKKLWAEQSRRNALLRIVRTNDGRKDILELTHVRLFQKLPMASSDSRRPTANTSHQKTVWTSPILQSWEPTDLGRQERLTLNRFAIEAGWNADRLALWLMQSTDNSSSLLSQYIDGYRVLNSTELVIDLRTPPRSFEAIFINAPPLISADGNPSYDQWQNRLPYWSIEQIEPGNSKNPLVTVLRQNGEWSRTKNTSASPLRWIQQTRLDSEADGVRELLRGEADFFPVIDPQDAVRFQKDSRFFTIPYAAPSIISLRFSPRSRLAQCEHIRQAMNLCLDRNKMAEVVAGTDGKHLVQPATEFFGQSGQRTTSLLGDRLSQFDPLTAATFFRLAKESCPEFNRPLRFETPSSDVFRRCHSILTNTLNRLGVPTETVPASSGLADVRWERSSVSSPLDDWMDLVRPDSPQRSAPLTAESPWNLMQSAAAAESSHTSGLSEWEFAVSKFRYLAAELQRTTNPETATRQALQLEYELRLSAWLLPVVRITDHAVCSKRLSRLPAEFVTPFDGIEQWQMNLEETSR